MLNLDFKTHRWISEHLDHHGINCLVWPYSRARNGYGHFQYKGNVRKAHRVMCTLVHGEPPTPEHQAAHSCGNRICVNPDHLSWKTPSQNQLDRRRHGTTAQNPWGQSGKLTRAQRREIAALKGQKTQYELAEMYGVSVQNVGYIHKNSPDRPLKMVTFQPEEDEHLIVCISHGIQPSDMANHLGRTEGSVTGRCRILKAKGLVP